MKVPDFIREMPKATRALLAAVLCGYILGNITGPAINGIFGLVPARVVGNYWVWQPFTYMFLHAGFTHFLLNAFMLWMFAAIIESAWGPKELLRYFTVCGLGGALCHLVFFHSSPVPVVGASAAIYGLLVAFAMLNPDATVYLYFLIPIKAKYLALLMGGLAFYASLANSSGTVANLAHLGGMVAGYLYIKAVPWFVVNLKSRIRFICSPRAETKCAPHAETLRHDMDAILDKINSKGMDSLSRSERDFMERISKKLGKQ